MEQATLSDLCSMCYTEKPKYRCPRCKTKTCSLPCYKRHQQRASCNGKRDPAAYLKKRELATPTGIDRDYNFLKGVERTTVDAGEDLRERGIETRSSAVGDYRRGHSQENAFSRYLRRNRIEVDYAPKGMSRQKSNKSFMTKKGQTRWTIEWIDGRGVRDVRHNAEDPSTLAELYSGLLVSKMTKTEQRAVAQAKSTKRRKISSPDPVADYEYETDGVVDSTLDVPAAEPVECEDPLGTTTEMGIPKPSSAVESTTSDTAQGSASQRMHADQVANPDETPSIDANADHSILESQKYIYLLKPSTSTPSTVLIPLKSGSTITEALRDKAVMEYPTIYVLDDAPDALPAGFVLEDDYLATLRRDVKDAEALVGNVDGRVQHQRDRQYEHSRADEQVDANAILNMLKRDVRT